jgi:acyl carrier protein
VVNRIKKILAELTGQEYATVEPGASFLDIGLDSLLLTQLSRSLQAEFKAPITFRRLMQELPTLTLVAAEIVATTPAAGSTSAAAIAPRDATPEPALAPSGALLQRIAHLEAMMRAAGLDPASGTNITAAAPLPPAAVLQKGGATTQPPVAGARLGRDPSGNPAWYVPDPQHPSQYRKVTTYA